MPDCVYLLIDPRGIPTEPAWTTRKQAEKAARKSNARLSDKILEINGDYWRVRQCALET